MVPTPPECLPFPMRLPLFRGHLCRGAPQAGYEHPYGWLRVDDTPKLVSSSAMPADGLLPFTTAGKCDCTLSTQRAAICWRYGEQTDTCLGPGAVRLSEGLR